MFKQQEESKEDFSENTWREIARSNNIHEINGNVNTWCAMRTKEQVEAGEYAWGKAEGGRKLLGRSPRSKSGEPTQ